MRRSGTVVVLAAALVGSLGFDSPVDPVQDLLTTSASHDEGSVEPLRAGGSATVGQHGWLTADVPTEDGEVRVWLWVDEVGSAGSDPAPETRRAYQLRVDECTAGGCSSDYWEGTFAPLAFGPTTSTIWGFSTSAGCGDVDVSWSLPSPLSATPTLDPTFEQDLPTWSHLDVLGGQPTAGNATGTVCGIAVDGAVGDVGAEATVAAHHTFDPNPEG